MTRRQGENLTLSTGRDGKVAVESLTRIYNNQSVLYRRILGREARAKIERWNKILPLIEDERAFISQISEFINCMIEELGQNKGIKPLRSSEPQEPEDTIIEHYNPESITDMRSRFIAQIMVQNDEKTLQSPQIRVLLEQQEGKPFSRSMVSRCIKNIPKFLNAGYDLFGGRLRIKRLTIFNMAKGPGLERPLG